MKAARLVFIHLERGYPPHLGNYLVVSFPCWPDVQTLCDHLFFFSHEIHRRVQWSFLKWHLPTRFYNSNSKKKKITCLCFFIICCDAVYSSFQTQNLLQRVLTFFLFEKILNLTGKNRFSAYTPFLGASFVLVFCTALN